MSVLGGRRLPFVIAMVFVLGACGGGGEPQPGLSPAPTATVTESAASPEVTETPEPVAPEMPDAAREITREGAEAFVRHYFDVVTYAYGTGDSSAVRRLSSTECSTCVNAIQSIDDAYEAGGRIEGARVEAVQAVAAPLMENGTIVSTVVKESASTELDAQGSVLSETAAGEGIAVTTYVLNDMGSWKIREIAPLDEE